MTQGTQTPDSSVPTTPQKPEGPSNEMGGGTMFDPSLLTAAGILPSSHPDSQRPGLADRLRNRKFWVRALSYVGLGVVSFLVFLYLTFPYAVIKEGLVGFVSDSLQNGAGIEARINIGSLKPYWFKGISLENVTITNNRDANAQIRFGTIRAQVNLLPLLIGRVGANLYITQSGGEMEVDLTLPISSLIAGAPALTRGDIIFKNFPIDSFVTQALSLAKGSNAPAMSLVLPLISVTSAGGMLNGNIGITSQDLNNPDTLKGQVNLAVKGMFLHINDTVLQIPKQEFTQARIEGTLDKGAVVFKDTTAFMAPDIDVALGGRMGPGQEPGIMEANLNLKLTMRGRIQTNFGNLVPTFLKCLQPLKEKNLDDGRREALLEARLIGPVTNMACEQIP